MVIETLPENKFDNYLDSLRNKYTLNNRLLLVQGLQFDIATFNLGIALEKGYYAFPPTGLLWLAKYLEGLGLETNILDLNYEFLKLVNERAAVPNKWLPILDDAIARYKPSIIGVGCTSVSNLFDGDHALISILKHLKDSDEHIIITGGVNSTDSYLALLERDLCHIVFFGESENKIQFFFRSLLHQRPQSVSGIFYKFNGKIETTGRVEQPIDLKGNLVEMYKHIPLVDYHKVGSLNPYSRMAGINKRYATIQLNRGCRGNCAFCGVSKFNGRGVRHFPTKDVITEIKFLAQKKGIQHFEWLDDDLLFYREEIKEVLQFIIDEKLGITWAANNGLVVASLDDKLLALMRDSGCIGFKVGIESGDEEMLRLIRKPLSLENLRRFSTNVQKYPELFVGGSYIIGFPYEKFSSIMKTFRLSIDLNLDWSNFAICQMQSWDNESRIQITEEFRMKSSTDFTPAKHNTEGVIDSIQEVLKGKDVFSLEPNSVPGQEQLKNIWFTFNLISNYINNKNLKPNGNPDNLAAWLKAIHIGYPRNPYMPLFTSLCYVALGKKKEAEGYLTRTKMLLSSSKYWNERFEQFGFHNLMENFPQNEEDVQHSLSLIQSECKKITSG